MIGPRQLTRLLSSVELLNLPNALALAEVLRATGWWGVVRIGRESPFARHYHVWCLRPPRSEYPQWVYHDETTFYTGQQAGRYFEEYR